MASSNSIINDLITIIRLSINTLDSNTTISSHSTLAQPIIEPVIVRPDYQSTLAQPIIEPVIVRPDYCLLYTSPSPRD